MTRPNGSHGSWASVTERVTEVYGWMVNGATTPQIHKLAGEQDPPWDVSPRTVRNYIAKARERFEEAARTIRDEELGKAIARLDSLYRRAMTARDPKGNPRPDYRTALAVEAKRIELLGLKVPERIEVTDLLGLVESEIARRRREIDELEAQYGLEPPPDRRA